MNVWRCRSGFAWTFHWNCDNKVLRIATKWRQTLSFIIITPCGSMPRQWFLNAVFGFWKVVPVVPRRGIHDTNSSSHLASRLTHSQLPSYVGTFEFCHTQINLLQHAQLSVSSNVDALQIVSLSFRWLLISVKRNLIKNINDIVNCNDTDVKKFLKNV